MFITVTDKTTDITLATATLNPEIGKMLMEHGAMRAQHIQIVVNKELLGVILSLVLPQLAKMGLFTAGPFGQEK